MDVPLFLYPTTGIDTASSVSNTSTAYNPSSSIPMTTPTSVVVTSDASTTTTSGHDSTTASFPAGSTAAPSLSTAGSSVPTTAGPTTVAPTTVAPSSPTTTTAPSVHASTTAPSVVTPSGFTLDPVKAKEFFDASDDVTLSLSDFLRKMDAVKDIYGADTEMIKGLTSNTNSHEKAKLKVRRCMSVCMSLLTCVLD